MLGTPRVVALAEEATVAALAGHLGKGETTRGDAGAARPPGPLRRWVPRVTADATLEKVEGRRLIFTVSIDDERGLVAAGKVTRVIVDLDKFLDKAR